MELECLREKLKGAVTVAEKITGKNLALPVLANVILEARKGNFKLRATNLDLGLEFSLPSKVIKTGAIAVNGNVLTKLINHLPSSNEKLSLKSEIGNLLITSSHQKTQLAGQSFEDFPSIPPVANPQFFPVARVNLLEGLREVWFSAASSNLRPEISSVCFYQQPEGVYLVATDSFRLAEKLLMPTPEGGLGVKQLIIPLRNIPGIIRILEMIAEENLRIEYNQHQIAFLTSDIFLTSRLVEGAFPDYRQIIPERYKTEIVLPRGELIDKLKLAGVLADKFYQADFVIKIDPSQLEIHTQSEAGNNLVWLAPLSVAGEGTKISFNLKYILDGLQTIPEENVLIKLHGGDRPSLLRGATNSSFTYLVMPVRR